jgi:hypothetical protein
MIMANLDGYLDVPATLSPSAEPQPLAVSIKRRYRHEWLATVGGVRGSPPLYGGGGRSDGDEDDDGDISPQVRKSWALAVEYLGKYNREMVRQAVTPVPLTFPRKAAETIILYKYVDCEQVYQHNTAYVTATKTLSSSSSLLLGRQKKNAHALLVLYEKVVKFTLRL